MNFDHLENSFYFNYYRIGQGAYRDKVKFYEDNKADLQLLDVDQQNEVKIDYLLCLFEIGRYDYFLQHVDETIETVIIDNIYKYNGYNIYNELLFRKSACLYNTNRFADSERVLKALIKLDERNIVARKLFTKCKRKHVSSQNEMVKAIAMVLLLSALSIAVMELFIVKPFYDEYIATFSGLKIFFFASAATLLVGSELYFKYHVGKDIGFKFDWRAKIKYINRWYLNLTGGNTPNDPF